jgi:hypothetical protein
MAGSSPSLLGRASLVIPTRLRHYASLLPQSKNCPRILRQFDPFNFQITRKHRAKQYNEGLAASVSLFPAKCTLNPRPRAFTRVVDLFLVRSVQRAFLYLIAVISVSCPGTPSQAGASEAAKPASLVFRGTVISITISPADFLQPWVITTRVDKVLSGSFSARQFQFSVHSPSQSGLNVGKQYTIRATRTKTGYSVDEFQWLYEPTRKVTPRPQRTQRTPLCEPL